MDKILYIPFLDAVLWTLGYAVVGFVVGYAVKALKSPPH